MKSSKDKQDLQVLIPLSDLLALQGLPSRVEALEADNKALRDQLAALLGRYSEILSKLRELV